MRQQRAASMASCLIISNQLLRPGMSQRLTLLRALGLEGGLHVGVEEGAAPFGGAELGGGQAASTAQVCTRERGVADVGVAKNCARQECALQIGAGQIGVEQDGTFHLRATEL